MRLSRGALLVWALVAALTNAPYLKAVLDPPPGRAFVGFFYYIDDAYNYLSFAQQAEDGAFLFKNKLSAQDHAPVLFNLEWWLVGRLSALLGGRPALSYRLFGVAAGLLLVVMLERALARAGVPPARRPASLALVLTGAGLGGVLFHLGVPGHRCLDLVTGLFPFIEMLANPHFVAGTALLLASLLAFADGRGGAGVLWGSALGLVRPYELAVLAGARALAVASTHRPREWPRLLGPLAGLVPVAAYNYWLFFHQPRLGIYASGRYLMPPLLDFLPALGPAVLVSALWWRTPAARWPWPAVELHLAAWALVGAAVAVFRPVPFPLQVLVGLGLPLLVLAAAGLARRRVAATVAATAALSPTALAALALVLSPSPRWHVPVERLQAARALRPSCSRSDLALAPPDIGLYAAGLASCRVYVAHPAAAGYEEREQKARRFYGPADPAWRAALLEAERVTRLVLPGDAGPVPAAWLGEATPFRLLARVGDGPGAISVYARSAGP